MKKFNLKAVLLLSICFYSSYGLSQDKAKPRDFFNEEHFTIEEPEATGKPYASGKSQTRNGIRIGAGDDKSGYETTGYTTNSRAITTRQGEKADLMRVVNNPPLGLPKIPQPVNNPLTEEKIDLGRKLFFDRRLSLNDTFSCAMCHIPEQGFTSYEVEKAVGLEGRSNRRNAPTIYNVAYLDRLFHDGRETSLENQIWGPLLAHNEMAMTSFGHVLQKLDTLKEYDGLFEAAFEGRGADILTLGRAIASYQRVLVSGNSAFDRWYFGNETKAITDQAIRGFDIFKNKGQCITCHTVGEKTALFTDKLVHNTGLGFKRAMVEEPEKERMLIAPGTYAYVVKSKKDLVGLPRMADVGVYEVTQDPDDRWKYRTPTLRNVAITAPYMHDGSMHNLTEVIAFYNQGGVLENEKGFPNVTQSPLIKPLGLTESEVKDLVAFMMTLTGDNVVEIISDAFATPVGDTTNE
jgi:cytochrome c peroxidase